MFSLQDLGAPIESCQITLRGKKVKVRELSAAETARVRRAFREPVPPLGPDLSKGSDAPPVPNRNDPGFIAQYSEWTTWATAVEVAMALELHVDGSGAPQEDAAFKVWAEKARAEIANTLSDREIFKVVKALGDLGEQDVRGNSSAPSAATPTGAARPGQ